MAIVDETSKCAHEVTPWTYLPNFIDGDYYFSKLLEPLNDACSTYPVNVYGKTFESNRKSCVFSLDPIDPKFWDSYNDLPFLGWDRSPQLLLDLKQMFERKFECRFDYVLVQFYRHGDDYIGWHNDKEALNTDIVSVSFGASRRFQFRPLKDKKGFSHEIMLNSGDVLHMHRPKNVKKEDGETKNEKIEGCQHMYKHSVPKMTCKDLKSYIEGRGFTIEGRATKEKINKIIKENDIEPIRISLTFRQYE